MKRLMMLSLVLVVFGVAPARAGTFLFEVTRGGQTVYLLGSIHVARPDMYPLPEVMEQSFAASDVLVVEVDVDRADQAAVMDLMTRHGMYPPGQTLSSSVNAATLELMRSLGHEPSMYDAMRPWMVVMNIQMMEFMKLGYNPEQGVDQHFMTEARQRSMPVEELESMERQIELLAGMSASDEDGFLYYSLLQMQSLGRIMERMSGMWRAGDVAGLTNLVFTELYDPAYEEFYDSLLYTRNRDMAGVVERYMRNGRKAFVIMGAAHLLGDRGVLALLEQRGCRVVQQ